MATSSDEEGGQILAMSAVPDAAALTVVNRSMRGRLVSGASPTHAPGPAPPEAALATAYMLPSDGVAATTQLGRLASHGSHTAEVAGVRGRNSNSNSSMRGSGHGSGSAVPPVVDAVSRPTAFTAGAGSSAPLALPLQPPASLPTSASEVQAVAPTHGSVGSAAARPAPLPRRSNAGGRAVRALEPLPSAVRAHGPSTAAHVQVPAMVSVVSDHGRAADSQALDMGTTPPNDDYDGDDHDGRGAQQQQAMGGAHAYVSVTPEATGDAPAGTTGDARAALARKRWHAAARKIAAVSALTARDRWMRRHGGEAKAAAERAMRALQKGGGRGDTQQPTRKAIRREYQATFGALGATLQQQKSTRAMLGGDNASNASGKSFSRSPLLRSMNVPSGSGSHFGGVTPVPGTTPEEPAHSKTPSPQLGPPPVLAVMGGSGGRRLRRTGSGHGHTRRPRASGSGQRRRSSVGAAVDALDAAVTGPLPDPAVNGAATATMERAASRWCAKCTYRLEEAFTKPRGKAVGLCTFAALQVVWGALLLQATDQQSSGESGADFSESMWESWTYVADPGTHADEFTWLRRAMSFTITVSGILLFAVVVGFVVDAIRARMEELKRGKSRVTEQGHYLILGWTDKSFSLIRELCLAMKSEGGGVVVILSQRDKTEVEGELSEQFSPRELCGSTVVCRTGSPLLMSDLNKVAASEARAIVILAEGGDADKADAKVLRTVLSLMGLRQPIKSHVVAELRDIDNEGLLKVIGRGAVETIVSHDIVGRLMIKCARQPGLADAYEMFLGFEGDEFYLSNWPSLAGTPFRDLLLFFPDAIPVGVKVADTGEVILNPDHSYTLATEDQVLFLAEDDDTYAPLPMPANVAATAPPTDFQEKPPAAETILMCGWRRDTDNLVELLDHLVHPGSELHIMSQVPVEDRDKRFADGGLDVDALPNLRLVHHVGNTSFRRHLERLPMEKYTSVLILAADDVGDPDSMHSDSSCLATLLLIRHIQESRLAAIARRGLAAWMSRGPGGSAGVADASARVSASFRLLVQPTASTPHSRVPAPGASSPHASTSRAAKRLRAAALRAAKSSAGRAPDAGQTLSVVAAGTHNTGDLYTGSEGETEGKEQPRPRFSLPSDAGDGPQPGDAQACQQPERRRRSRHKRRSRTLNVDDVPAALRGANPAHGSRPGQQSVSPVPAAASRYRALYSPRTQADGRAAAPPSGVLAAAAAAAAPTSPLRAHTKAAAPTSPLRAHTKTKVKGKGGQRHSAGHLQLLDAASGRSAQATADKALDILGSLMCCELLDVRTRTVVQENPAIVALGDYILSNNIVSRVLAMVAERREVEQVLAELLGPDGQEVVVKSAAGYVRDGEALSFWELALRVQAFGEILLGYKPALLHVHAPLADAASASGSIVTNPRNKDVQRVWRRTEMVVVMAPSASESAATLQRQPGELQPVDVNSEQS